MSKKMTLDMIKKVICLESVVDNILKSASSKYGVDTVCKKYKQLLSEGRPEELLYKSFLNEMSVYNSISSVNTELLLLEKRINDNKNDIDVITLLHEMYDGGDYLAPMFESDVVSYLVSKDADSTEKLKTTLSLFKGVDSARRILESVTMDEYSKKINGTVNKQTLNESVIETERLYTKDEVKRIVKNKVKENELKESKNDADLKLSSLENRVRLQSSISNILSKTQQNDKIKTFCESYTNELRNGKSDVMLYESFINGMSQWNYLNAVDTEMSALKERISKYKQEIDLTKILEMMLQTQSYYIVPIIESSVVSYMNNKNVATRAMLKQSCEPFMFDPFIKDMLNVVNGDMSLNSGLYLGESIETLNNKVHTETVFSPILYVKENESIFNISGTYYSKKGAHITKLTKNDIRNVSEAFKNTCNVLNKSNVIFDEAIDAIKIYGDNDIASINEFGVTINGNKVTESELNDINYQAFLSRDDKSDFIQDVKTINENYGTIAMLDFVKRVKMNESDKSVDVFKIKNNISLSLSENANTVFYRNVNPIQCKSYINEHMELTITPMFEELLPEQEAIVNEITETKKSYESYIEELKEKKQQLEALKESGDIEDEEILEGAIKLVDSELEEVIADYKEYQENADIYTGDIKAEEDNDITDVQADVATGELTTPITGEVDADGVVGDEVVGDEFVGETEPQNIEYDPVLEPVNDKGFEIIKVTYNKNIKTDTITNKGTVNILIPTVNSNGDVHDEIKTVTFMLDQDRNPVINNDYMSVVMYNEIKDAIRNCPDTKSVDIESVPESPESELNVSIAPTDAEISLPTDSEKDSIDSVVVDNTPTLDDVNAETMDIGSGFTDDLVSKIEDVAPEGTEAKTITNEIPIDQVERETPAETLEVDAEKEKDESSITVTFPIKIGLMFDEIKPISASKFQEDLDAQNIEYTLSSNPKPGLIIDVNNKAEMFFIKDYFKTWLNVSDNGFYGAFPELKCFESTISRFVNEKKEEFEEVVVDLPFDETLSEILDDNKFDVDVVDDDLMSITITTEDDMDDFKQIMKDYKKDNEDLSDELLEVIDDILIDDIVDVVFDYDGKLVTALEKKSIKYKDTDDDKLIVSVLDTEEADDLLEVIDSVGITPENLDELTDFAGLEKIEESESLTEGVKITVEDTKTNKKVVIDTDDLNADDEKEETDDKDEDDDAENSKKDDEDKDKDDKKEDDSDDSNDSVSFDNDTELFKTPQEEPEEDEKKEEAVEPKKKVFKFKPKAKITESVVAITESVDANVLDRVYYKGKEGTVTGKTADGKFIVLTDGSTHVCEQSELKLNYDKKDLVETNFKYDEKTLAGLYEQLVQCGIFMNGTQLTPNNCYCKYSEYKKAQMNEDVRVLIDGQSTLTKKQHVKLLEDVSEFANIKEYIEGVTLDSQGKAVKNILINAVDYGNAKNDSDLVRVLVPDENGKTELITMPKYAIKTLAI